MSKKINFEYIYPYLDRMTFDKEDVCELGPRTKI